MKRSPKKIITIFTIATVVLVATIILIYQLTLVSVKINIPSSEVTKVTIFDSQSSEPIEELSQSASLRLAKGDYSYQVAGKNIADRSVNFSVGESPASIDIDYFYTTEKLRDILEKENSAISSAITAKYPSLTKNYDILNEELYQKGEWAGVIFRKTGLNDQDLFDTYRIVLNKTDGKWRIINRPELILSKYVFPDVPKSILDTINNLQPF